MSYMHLPIYPTIQKTAAVVIKYFALFWGVIILKYIYLIKISTI